MEPVPGIVVRFSGLCKPPCLDEFVLVKTGALFHNIFCLTKGLELIDKVLPDPRCRPVPLDICEPILNVNRSRKSVKTDAVPVPELEGEIVGCSADLEDHRICR